MTTQNEKDFLLDVLRGLDLERARDMIGKSLSQQCQWIRDVENDEWPGWYFNYMGENICINQEISTGQLYLHTVKGGDFVFNRDDIDRVLAKIVVA
jgi:hypothetical protein